MQHTTSNTCNVDDDVVPCPRRFEVGDIITNIESGTTYVITSLELKSFADVGISQQSYYVMNYMRVDWLLVDNNTDQHAIAASMKFNAAHERFKHASLDVLLLGRQRLDAAIADNLTRMTK